MRPPTLTPRKRAWPFSRRNTIRIGLILFLILTFIGVLSFVRRRFTTIGDDNTHNVHQQQPQQPQQEKPPLANNDNAVIVSHTPTQFQPPPPPQQQQPSRPVVFVLGMHHSMTSIATKLLIDLGLWAGDVRELLIRPDNPFKYFEHGKVVDMNQAYFDRMLEFNPDRGPYDWLGYNLPLSAGDEKLIKDAETIITDLAHRAQAKKTCLVVKDPRMSLVADPWLKAAKDASGGTPPVCIILVRDPEETAIRFLEYNTAKKELSVKEWYSVWEQYTFRAFASCISAGARIHVIRNDDFATSPKRVMRSMIADLGETVFSNVAGTDKILAREDLLPAGFEAKHGMRSKIWNDIKHKVSPRNLVSIPGIVLWQKVQQDTLPMVRSVPDWIPLSHKIDREAVVIFINHAEAPSDVRDAVALIRSLLVVDASRKFLALVDASFRSRTEMANAGWKLVHHPTSEVINLDSMRRLGLDKMLLLSTNCIAAGDWTVLFTGAAMTRAMVQGACEAKMYMQGSTSSVAHVDPEWQQTQNTLLDATRGLGKEIRDGMVALSGKTSNMQTVPHL